MENKFISALLAIVIPALVVAQGLKLTVPINEGWVFTSPQKPSLLIRGINESDQVQTKPLSIFVETDTHKLVYRLDQNITVPPKDSLTNAISLQSIKPGFYHCLVKSEQDTIRSFNFGFDPENIYSPADYKADFHQFWSQTKKELAQVKPEYSLTLIPDSSNNVCKLYRVRMKSFGGVEIQGFYSVPVKKGKYPCVVSYMGYGSKPWAPGPNDNPHRVLFVLSTRGQGLCESTNPYGDWVTYNLNNRDTYYYRGAFMDLIRAVDFVSSRPEVRKDAIFAEGASQGGAFTLVAAALDKRIVAIAPCIPFLSDFKDYFNIVNWPATPIRAKQSEMWMSNEDLFKVLSYFDVKNFAHMIHCPVMMSVGLQDPVCPPHTNFSSYNLIRAPKSYSIYPVCKHDVPKEWWPKRDAFFEKYTPKK